jgi:hypothetical protein
MNIDGTSVIGKIYSRNTASTYIRIAPINNYDYSPKKQLQDKFPYSSVRDKVRSQIKSLLDPSPKLAPL